MGKNDVKQTKKRAHKGTCDESKHKNNTLGISPFGTTFEDNGAAIRRHSQWCDGFRQLCEYKVQFGHCRVPFKYSTNPKLGRWVWNQRSNFKLHQEGKPSPITAERIRELESVGFKWAPNAVSWNKRFEQLREFTVLFGHCVVPINYSANPKLGQWVSTQRRYCKLYQEGNPSPITAKRIGELDNVGFEWE
jgi:hypothetical protein